MTKKENETEKELEARYEEASKREVDKWAAAFNLPENRSKEVLLAELSKRVYKGELVHAIVVDTPREVIPAAKKAIEEAGDTPEQVAANLKVLEGVADCCWDYWRIALYSSLAVGCEISDPHLDQSFFEAFKAGFQSIVQLGGLVIGVMLPELIATDSEGRLHSMSGPAIQYKDEKQYWYEGVRVEEEWIESPDTVDASQFLNIQNAEKRIAFCNIITWERILSDLSAEEIDKDWDNKIGTLLRVDLPEAPGSMFVRAKCGTGRMVCMSVPDDMKTAIQAQAWMYSVSEDVMRSMSIRT